MVSLFHILISNPLYNGLILLIDYLPWLDIGVIVIIFTVLVKLLLLPLSVKATKAQIKLKAAEKDLQVIKEKYTDKSEQSVKTLEYYKEHGIKPFSSVLILIIQFPILIGLYRIFLKSGLPSINTDILYHFVNVPPPINMMFLSLIDIAGKSFTLALLAGVTSYFQISLSTNVPGPQIKTPPGMPQGTDISKIMAMQMKYFFPLLMVFIAYSVSSAIALYLITSNVFAIIQEVYIRKKYHKGTIVV